MTLTINISDDIRQLLEQRATEAGQDVSSYLEQFVAERLVEEPGTPSKLSPEEFERAAREIMNVLPMSEGPLDTSRESIY